MEIQDFLQLPYADRQLAIFVDDNLLEDSPKEELDISQITRWLVSRYSMQGLVIKAIAMSPQYRPNLEKVFPHLFNDSKPVKVQDITKQALRSGFNITLLPKSWLSQIRLPPGHPRNRIVYVSHPTTTGVYMPIADFHRYTFEDKFSEILSLLMHLGAKEIKVKHVQGWGKEFSAKLNVGIAEPLGEINAKHQHDRQILYEATLSGSSEPILPQNLHWYEFESTWQKMAEGRIKFGLKDFNVSMKYQDDYGVNASLKAMIADIGFEIGGEFEKHESTAWEIYGKF